VFGFAHRLVFGTAIGGVASMKRFCAKAGAETPATIAAIIAAHKNFLGSILLSLPPRVSWYFQTAQNGRRAIRW
jgi:hypothetical protein